MFGSVLRVLELLQSAHQKPKHATIPVSRHKIISSDAEWWERREGGKRGGRVGGVTDLILFFPSSLGSAFGLGGAVVATTEDWREG